MTHISHVHRPRYRFHISYCFRVIEDGIITKYFWSGTYWSFKKVFKFWDFLGILSPKGGPMARKRIEVTLTPDEHESLSTYVAHGHKSAREINRARILLLAHDGHTDADIV